MLGSNSSAINTWKSEVCLAVQANNPERLYYLFMLATRHQLGEIEITASNVGGVAVGMASTLIAKITGTDQSISGDEYMRSTATHSGGSYVAFNDSGARQPMQNQGPPRPMLSSAPTSPHSNMGAISGPPLPRLSQSQSANAPSSAGYFSSLTTYFSSKSTAPQPASQYATLHDGPTQQQPSSYAPPRPAAAASNPVETRPAYSPPSLSAEYKTEAQKAAAEIIKPMAGLLSSGSERHSPHAQSLLDQSQPANGSLQPTPVHSHHSSPVHAPVPQPYTAPVNAGSSPPTGPSATAEFSPATLPVNINTLWIGNDSLLIYAAKQDQTSIIHLLHQAGSDLEYADPNGWSALHHAAAANCVRSVKALLDIGSDALAHSKLGLTPSQCTPHPEIKRELEAEEAARRHGIEQQVAAIAAAQTRIPLMTQTANGMAPTQSKTQSVFHVSLYQIIVPVEIRSGSRFEVLYRAPARHSTSDCLCVYYCDEKKPSDIKARIGRTVYLPDKPPSKGEIFSKIIVQADDKLLPPGSYRFLYYNAKEASFPTASNMFKVIPAPSSKHSSSLASWFDPAAWKADASAQPIEMTQAQSSTPIILHPDFQSLSELSPINIESFLVPLPPYFLFSFTLNPHAVRLVSELDGRLLDLRDRLVPSRMAEKDFWAAYFYKMIALDFYEQQQHLHYQQQHPSQQPPLLSFSTPISPSAAQLQDGPVEDTPRGESSNPPFPTSSS